MGRRSGGQIRGQMRVGTRFVTGRVRSDGSRSQITRLGPGMSGSLRLGSDGMGASRGLGAMGWGRQEQEPDWGTRGHVQWVTLSVIGYQTWMEHQIGKGYR